MPSLSSLTAHFDAPTNKLYELRDRYVRESVSFHDLVSGNVGTGGIRYPEALLKKALMQAVKQTSVYKPDPLGQLGARRAISNYYRDHGASVSEKSIVLTPGTSISYWYALKLLSNPGDEVLIPSPSYPLFDAIAELCHVKLVPYRLREGARWQIDFESLTAAASARTKAVILISPHNPTGAVATDEEVHRLSDFAAQHKLAILADEVFSPFVYTGDSFARPLGGKAPLVLTLNGFSKMLALPGMKIGWIAVSGDGKLVQKALHTLDMISDTFLPVNELAQAAVSALLKKSASFQSRYTKELKKRRDLVADMLGIEPPEGGFFAAVPIRAKDEEHTVCELLERHKLLVHPGYFYDMEGRHIVFSFASQPRVLKKSLEIIRNFL